MEFVQSQISVSCFVCSDLQEEGDDDLVFKMVFVVNMDLAMGVGKVRLEVPNVLFPQNDTQSIQIVSQSFNSGLVMVFYSIKKDLGKHFDPTLRTVFPVTFILVKVVTFAIKKFIVLVQFSFASSTLNFI